MFNIYIYIYIYVCVCVCMYGDVSAGSICIQEYRFSPENWHDLYEGLLKRLLVEIGQLF